VAYGERVQPTNQPDAQPYPTSLMLNKILTSISTSHHQTQNMANQSQRRVLPFSDPSVHLHPLEHPETSNLFLYTPLDPSVDCIRPVILEPGPSSRIYQPIIYCRLKHVPFSEKPKYEALSYTWGDESIKHRIVIDEKDFQVGINLLNALTHLRHAMKRDFCGSTPFVSTSRMSERRAVRFVSCHISIQEPRKL
jgi:hypothetical protein